HANIMGNGYDHVPIDPPNPYLLSMISCGCEDCQAAVSPLAYLADLLDYALEHIKQNNLPIHLPVLTATFHQPFADLPADCEAMEKRVRQVRIAIEVLRDYLGPNAPPSAAEQSYCLSAYKALLNQVGTSYEEIRLARTDTPENRQALADRLGIDL